jgi:hypothetical protein
VRLEAGGGVNVPSVTFQVREGISPIYSDIATVATRNDDGAFSYEWTPAANGIFPGNFYDLRVINTAVPAEEDTDGLFTLRLATAVDTHAINLTEGSQKGYFDDPATPAVGDYTLGVVGTTSVTSTDLADQPDVAWMNGGGGQVNTSNDTSNSGDGTFEGVLAFTDGSYDLDDPNLPPAEADQMVVRARTDADIAPGTDRQTDDFEGFTLYEQVLTSVTATLAPAVEPDPGTVTITVLDQNSQPIAGIRVYDASGTQLTAPGPDRTDGRGQITVPQSDNVNYYYANADAVNNVFSPGGGDKRSNDVNNLAAVVDITTSPSDANVPLGTTVTETVKVTDTNGDPISNRPVRIKRTGPSDNGETVFKTTNDAGELTYTFTCNVEGVASLEVGIQGPVAPLADPFTFAIGYDTVNCGNPPGPSDITALLSGKSSQGKDILRVYTQAVAKGAKVVLQKKVNGKWTQVGKVKNLDDAGDRQFSVKDRNGKKITKFRAIVSPTASSQGDLTPVLRQK